MAGPYNAGQAAIRAVLVDPTNGFDLSGAGTASGRQTATIANGASLSDVVDCGATSRAFRLVMPAAWTAAGLTVQSSADGITFSNLYTTAGAEYTITTDASRDVILPLADFIGIRYFRLRSGTAGAPVNQGASRAIGVISQAL